MVRIVNGTKGLWDERSMVRMVYTWYEKSVVRIVNGTNSLVIEWLNDRPTKGHQSLHCSNFFLLLNRFLRIISHVWAFLTWTIATINKCITSNFVWQQWWQRRWSQVWRTNSIATMIILRPSVLIPVSTCLSDGGIQLGMPHRRTAKDSIGLCINKAILGRLKTQEWKTRDGRKVALENAGEQMHYRKTPECPLWKAKMHLSICKRPMCVSAFYLSIRVIAFSSAAKTPII